MYKQKSIENAVIELGGVFPDKSGKCVFLCMGDTGFLFAGDHSTLDHVICHRLEFEAAAKRMGYINGYKLGVEYTTGGEKPDLPDDVVVQVKLLKGDAFYGERPAHLWYWGKVYSFRITDERYKPEPEEGPVEPEQPKSWYEAGELPPVGIECEIGWSGSDSSVWYGGVVTYRSEKYTIIVYCDGSEVCYSESELDEVKFRPLRTKRERTIAAADAVIRKTSSAVDDVAINALYDAGLLRLPDNKNKD